MKLYGPENVFDRLMIFDSDTYRSFVVVVGGGAVAVTVSLFFIAIVVGLNMRSQLFNTSFERRRKKYAL